VANHALGNVHTNSGFSGRVCKANNGVYKNGCMMTIFVAMDKFPCTKYNTYRLISQRSQRAE